MGRAGITLLDVENAALQLQGRGKKPTVDGIRELLGTGSKSTIIQHLNTWKSKSNEVSGSLPQDLLALVTGLWERLHTDANQRIIDIENTHEKSLQELRQILHQTQHDFSELKNSHHHIEELFLSEKTTKQSLESELKNQQEELAKLSERYDGCITQIENYKIENGKLHQLATNMQANLEHFQQASQLARTEQALLMEKQQHEFQEQLKALQAEITIYKNRSHVTEQQLHQKTHDLDAIQMKYSALEQNHASLSQQYNHTSQEVLILKDRDTQLQQSIEKNELALKNKTELCINLEKDFAINSDRLTHLQKDFSNAENKIEILRNEKIFLIQEKSELQGHVNQLEKILRNANEKILIP